jgi:hypothetical protein
MFLRFDVSMQPSTPPPPPRMKSTINSTIVTALYLMHWYIHLEDENAMIEQAQSPTSHTYHTC